MYCLKVRMKATILIKLPLEEITIYFCNKFTGFFFKCKLKKVSICLNFILHTIIILLALLNRKPKTEC